MVITGSATANTLGVTVAAGVLASVDGGSVAGVESASADLGDGVDTLSYAGTTTGVTVNLGAGTATGFASIAGIENATGGNGNDLLVDAAGVVNTLSGGAGDDVYVVHDTADAVVEGSGGGTDEVRTDLASYTISNSNLENLVFTGTGVFRGTGNAVNNTITGGAGDDSLSGLGGNDRLEGGLGNDTLNGGTGTDVFVFAPSFGLDKVVDFDANALGGQDRLDISALGITAATFAASVSISIGNLDGIGGLDTLVNIGGNTISLFGVDGIGANVVNQSDFILA
jgi:Ca2+-binding RTX toxin-like protein